MKVWPKNETMRKILKHPSDRVGFREEGPAEWPDDAFTMRRLDDGDVLNSDPNPPEEEEVKAEPPAKKK